MTTKASGGTITGLLALTMEAQVALDVGDPVMVTGPYEVGLCDGTKPTIGVVGTANVKRLGRDYPVAKVPGDVAVETTGFYVRECVAGAAIAAGVLVGWNGSGALVTAGAGVATCGISLQPAAGAASKLDVLFK